MEVEMTGYFRSLRRSLHCPKRVSGPFLERTRRLAEDFVQGKPDATVQDVVDYLGDPRELAQGFMETLDPEVLERYHRRRKLLFCGLVALMAAVIVYLSIWIYKMWTFPDKLEVTETTIIYAIDDDETQGKDVG